MTLGIGRRARGLEERGQLTTDADHDVADPDVPGLVPTRSKPEHEHGAARSAATMTLAVQAVDDDASQRADEEGGQEARHQHGGDDGARAGESSSRSVSSAT